MKYVEVRVMDDRLHSWWHDPRAYLSALPTFARDLPSGARMWAEDPDHYDFSSLQCVKDLWFGSFDWTAGRLILLPNKWKHESMLVVDYEPPLDVLMELGPAPGTAPPSVRLDEVLPDTQGCTHELSFAGGRMMVTAADLVATWRQAPSGVRVPIGSDLSP